MLENVILIIFLVSLNLYLLKVKMNDMLIIPLAVGVLTIVVMFIASDLPYFPTTNIIIGIIALGNILGIFR